MSMNKAGVASLTLAQIAYNDIQAYLVASAVILPTITNLTSILEDGAGSVSVPRFSGLVATNQTADGSRQADGAYTVAVDTLVLNLDRVVPQYIYDVAQRNSTVDLQSEFFKDAARVFAADVETQNWTALKNVCAQTNYFQMSGTDSDGAAHSALTLADFAKGKKTLDKANCPSEGRFAVAGPDTMAEVLLIPNIIKVNESGDNSSLRNGECGKLMGITLLQSNIIGAEKGMAIYHSSTLAVAYQELVNTVSERQEDYNRTYCAVKGSWGNKGLDNGKRACFFGTGATFGA